MKQPAHRSFHDAPAPFPATTRVMGRRSAVLALDDDAQPDPQGATIGAVTYVTLS
jgi:hypothetical protein